MLSMTCDLEGRYEASGHIARTCIAPGDPCTSDAECTDPELSACAGGLCRECNVAHECSATAPLCDSPVAYASNGCSTDAS
jgi:hypothetical protein